VIDRVIKPWINLNKKPEIKSFLLGGREDPLKHRSD